MVRRISSITNCSWTGFWFAFSYIFFVMFTCSYIFSIMLTGSQGIYLIIGAFNRWLHSPKVLSSVTVMKKVLDQHQPKTKIPAKEPKTSARVLTGDEHRRNMNEKQERKIQEEERKAQKKAERGECMKIHLLT